MENKQKNDIQKLLFQNLLKFAEDNKLMISVSRFRLGSYDGPDNINGVGLDIEVGLWNQE